MERAKAYHCLLQVNHPCDSQELHIHVPITFAAGALITVNFFPYIDGSIAQIMLDGENVTQVDTYNTSGIGSDGYACTPTPWTSDVLSQGYHTISVTELDPNPAISKGLITLLSFVYVMPWFCLTKTIWS
jgi:hypothetical protein